MRAGVTDPEHLLQSARGLRFSHSNVAEFEVSSKVPEKNNFFFSTTCVDILMRTFFWPRLLGGVGGDCVASCLCCRCVVAEGVSPSRTNRTRTYHRNALSVFAVALTVVTWALEVLERRRYPVTLAMKRRIPEERNVHLFVCKVGCLSSQGQKLIAMNLGYFVHWGFVNASFNLLAPELFF